VVIVALIGTWASLHQRKPKPNPNPDKPLVGNHDSPSLDAFDLNERGLSSYDQERYLEALNYYQQALVIQRKVRDRTGEGITLNNIGGVYASLGQYDQALHSYQQALVIHQQALVIQRKVRDRTGEGITLNNIGDVYSAREQYDQALQSYQQALVIAREVVDKALEETVVANIKSLPSELADRCTRTSE
jgi:tetratricopeptide (TPR) repeat protein